MARFVDRKIRSSYSYGKLTYRQRDLWHGLIEVVDDQGRIPASPVYIRSQVWAYDDVPPEEVQKDLAVLVSFKMVLIYKIDGEEYLQILNWWKYQGSSNWMGKSNHPAPPGWIDRCRYHGKGRAIIKLNWDKDGGFELCSGQDSGLHSELHSGQGRELGGALPCNDVNDNDNDNVKGNDNDEDEENPCCISDNEQLEKIFIGCYVEETGLPLTDDMLIPSDREALETMVKVGATLEDFKAGIDWMKENNHPIMGIRSLDGPVLFAFQKRKGGTESYKKFTAGTYAKFIKNNQGDQP